MVPTNLTLHEGLTIGKGITFGAGTGGGGGPTVTANGTSFTGGQTITWTISNYTPNTTLYFWIDGNAYSYGNFTIPPSDGTTTVTTNGSGSATFSLTLTAFATPYSSFTAYFAPTLYQGNVSGLHTAAVTVI